MKSSRQILCIVLLFACSAYSQQPVAGDIWRWMPFEGGATGKEAEIVRNTQYVSVKIEAAHVSYKSGFLENIKQIVVSSTVTFDLGTQKIQALTINRTWQKSKNSDDNISGVNDLLAVLSPASPSSVSIKVSFAGIGEDKFKGIFDVLANNDTKTALNLSPATIAQAGLVTSIAQKFLATPYTSNNPKDVLSMSQGFVIYPDNTADRVDALRQGYIVVISGSEKKSNDLNKVTSLGSGSLRFDTNNHVLQLKQDNGTWTEFTGNSYVVLSVTVDTVRGTDENSPWFKKFAEADRVTENLQTGDAIDKVKKNAMSLYQEGSTLLAADPNYIESERKSIRSKALALIQEDLRKNGATSAEANLAATTPGVPANITEIAKEYDQVIANAKLGGNVKVRVLDPSGNGVMGAQVLAKNSVTGETRTTTTDATGVAFFGALNQSTYTIQAVRPGFGIISAADVALQARQTKEVSVQAK